MLSWIWRFSWLLESFLRGSGSQCWLQVRISWGRFKKPQYLPTSLRGSWCLDPYKILGVSHVCSWCRLSAVAFASASGMVSPSVSSPARHSVNFHTELWGYVWKSASAYSTQGPSSFHAVQTLSLPNYSPLLCSLAYMLSHLSHVWLFATLWTVACHTPLSMGSSRQDYWNGLPCPPPGDLFA